MQDRAHLPEWLALVTTDGPAVTSAVQVAGGLMGLISGSDLARFDRDARRWSGSEGWWRLRAKDVRVLAQVTEAPVAVGALSSVHRDGHVREAGVRLLGEHRTGRELRWLLLRTTDWVDEVRELADEAVRARVFGPEGAAYLGPLADDVAFLVSDRVAGNPTGAQLSGELLAVLQDAGLEHLKVAAQSSDWFARRAAVELLIGVAPPMELLASQLSGGDVVALTSAARAAFETDEATDAANLLLGSPWASIREEALWTVLDREGPNQDLVEWGLRDQTVRVRAVAQRAASGAEIDAVEWYRGQVGTTPVVALLGLGDIGVAEDAQLAELFVEARRSRLRAAAIRVLAQKGGSGYVDVLTSAALADSSRVSREAVRGLIRRGISDERARDLWSEAKEHHPATGPTRVLGQLLPRASRWAAMRCGLEALLESDPAVRAAGLRLLQRTWSAWNRSAIETSPAEKDALRELLDQASSVLEEAGGGLLDGYRSVVPPAIQEPESLEAPVEPAAESEVVAEQVAVAPAGESVEAALAEQPEVVAREPSVPEAPEALDEPEEPEVVVEEPGVPDEPEALVEPEEMSDEPELAPDEPQEIEAPGVPPEPEVVAEEPEPTPHAEPEPPVPAHLEQLPAGQADPEPPARSSRWFRRGRGKERP